MDEWVEKKLSDLCDSVDYGLTASACVDPVGPRFLRITDIVGQTLKWDDVPYVQTSDRDTEKYRLDDGDIVIARTGATTGESRYIQNLPDAVFASYLVRLKINSKYDRRFVGYLLKTPDFHRYLQSVSSGKSAQPNASASAMTRYSAHIPQNLEKQKAIASVLGVLDDKIESNQRMNETLEAMAQAIFRDWFVNFGPTRAKMEGRAPYLTPDLWNLFPDKLDAEGKPEGWKISEIGKEVDAVGGTTPSTKEPAYWEGGVHCWATPKDLSRLNVPVLLDTERKLTEAGIRKISSGLLSAGTVLLSSRAPVGYLAISEVPTAVNQGFIAMICNKQLSSEFILFWCKENLNLIRGLSSGSTFAEISKKVFRPIPVIVPTKKILLAHSKLIRPIYEQIVANEKEMGSLVGARDLMLPKLMSGKIRSVSEVM